MEGFVDDTLTFSKIAKQLANHYKPENFVSIRVIFIYESDGWRVGDNKVSFFSGYGIIEDH